MRIEVKSGSTVLLTGDTKNQDYDTILARGPEYYNNNLDDAFGGGNFTVNKSAERFQKQVLATGALPQGTYTIELSLYNSAGGGPFGPTRVITVIVTPPYLQPISPVDVSVTRDALNFRWATNIDDGGTDPVEFHLFTDPRGNREVRESGLPVLGITGSSLPGSAVAPFLANGATYYWQIWGKITTSHGEERVKSALSRFVYFEESASVVDLGLTDTEKNSVKSELLAILEEIVNKRAARSIREYELDRAVLDNGVVTYEEIMAILSIIKRKQVTVNAIYFK